MTPETLESPDAGMPLPQRRQQHAGEVGDLGKLAHQMEHVLGTVKRGEQTFSADTFDRLAHGMDAIRQMVHESVTGEPAEVDLFHVMAELMGANSPGQDLAETDSAADAF